MLFSRSKCVALAFFTLLSCVVRADIYEWEYVDPADPSQGKQQSATLVPDGAGVDAVPGAILTSLNLTKAFLSHADVTAVNFQTSRLENADLSGSQLSKANFNGAFLAGAVLEDADIRDAVLSRTTSRGFSAEQLYSTASYKDRDLTGVSFAGNCPAPGNDFTSWNFFGQDVSRGSFGTVNLTNADFRHATLVGTSFSRATLTGTRVDDADVRSATFTNAIALGFSLAQLYSTASYKNKDLSGIVINGDLNGIELADIKLGGANFVAAALQNANFSGADLTEGRLSEAVFTNANFAGAKIERASFQRSATSATESGLTLGQLYSTLLHGQLPEPQAGWSRPRRSQLNGCGFCRPRS